MSFIAIPASVAWLQTANDNTVQWEHFRQCMLDHAEWLRASGVDPFMVMDPDRFAAPGDLQLLSNVVSNWPKDAPPAYHPPTLYSILQQMRVPEGDEHRRFDAVLGWHIDRVNGWLIGQRRDPNNPNESKADREARLNRERVARHRLRHGAESDDPEEAALMRAAKAAMENVTAGRKWIKGAERQAKLDMDAAIAAARVARADTVSGYSAALQQAELQAHAAQSALDAYRIRK